jgi:hypothetical protein
MGKNKWQQVIGEYEKLRRDGKLPATFEVVYGHAWKPFDPRSMLTPETRRQLGCRLNMAQGYFVTGTDTGVGKTTVSCALLRAFAAQGKKVIGMKPVVAGSENGKWPDVEQLIAASNISAAREYVNPYAFDPPSHRISPRNKLGPKSILR